MVGGAHKWLYEIYSRWPTQVRVLTSVYSSDPEELREQKLFDLSAPNLLKISRSVVTPPLPDALSAGYLARVSRQVKAIGKMVALKEGMGEDKATIHVLRAIPEGVPAWIYSRFRSRSTRLVTFAHGEEVLVSQTSRQLRMIARRVYEDSDLVIANSKNTQKLLAEAFPNARSVCIHPGVNSESFRLAPGERIDYRARFGWPQETIIVFTLARMERRKNHAMLIHAVSELHKERMSVALICGGDGPERAELQKLVSTFGLSNWVKFLGVISEEEKPKVFASSDIFAMPSISVGQMIEGFGIVLLEAAAAGLPTICGNTGGQNEAIRDGESGFAVDGNSVVAVTDALRRLGKDSELRQKFGAEGRKLAAEHDWRRLTQMVVTEVKNCWG